MRVVIFILILSSCISCKKEVGAAGPQGPAGNTGPNGISTNDTGTISGKLAVYNEFSNKENDFSGAIVTMSSGNLTVKDTSDAAGAYQFRGLPTGTYNFTYEKPGYGMYKIFGVSHIPTGTNETEVQDVYLMQIPIKTAVKKISLVETAYSTSVGIYLDSSLSNVQYFQDFVIIVGKDENVNINTAVKTYETGFTDGKNYYTYQLSKNLIRVFFHPGENASVKVATYIHRILTGVGPNMLDIGAASYYIDPDTGNYVYPDMSVSPNALRIIL